MAKRITLYGIFTCLALIFGYIESLFSLSFIAPGIKIGLANCIFYYIFRPFSIYLLRYFTEPFIILVLESSDIFSDEANISFDIFYMPGAFYILYTGFAIAFIYWLKNFYSAKL